jgi:uncharacterized SAM-binding protein YcdF (DUF218 family)
MALESWVHHWVEGAPTATSRWMMSTVRARTMGIRPSTVVGVLCVVPYVGFFARSQEGATLMDTNTAIVLVLAPLIVLAGGFL